MSSIKIKCALDIMYLHSYLVIEMESSIVKIYICDIRGILRGILGTVVVFRTHAPADAARQQAHTVCLRCHNVMSWLGIA